ncbi:MAG: DNA-formamidopyrimidine glycosylase [Gammaproteobacteria bacterium]|nr:MAG: DNA-formamidopyrimidine glycosylase [Gammaproteobacteria bacterium]PIE37037.1 MAG: DNA-formamidopyrimidine glycosylase [Gammaproteobacteria bacterium]
MPELPEVETTRRGIEPFLVGARVTRLDIHEARLRWPVPAELHSLVGQRIHHVGRRGKYLLLGADHGTVIVHLGMSGSLRLAPSDEARRRHDHLELHVDSSPSVLRYHDPRRFGCWLWTEEAPENHPLIASLGPEPLGNHFNGTSLFAATRKRRVPIKVLIMNSRVVTGVGNIYASEALFMAGIRPGRAARRISRAEAEALAAAIRAVLQKSIEHGGTTLRDFVNGNGQPGYFAQSLNVYGREGEPCHACGKAIRMKIMGQRSTFYCPRCQR